MQKDVRLCTAESNKWLFTQHLPTSALHQRSFVTFFLFPKSAYAHIFLSTPVYSCAGRMEPLICPFQPSKVRKTNLSTHVLRGKNKKKKKE